MDSPTMARVVSRSFFHWAASPRYPCSTTGTAYGWGTKLPGVEAWPLGALLQCLGVGREAARA